MNAQKKQVITDFCIIIFSLIIALMFAKTGFLKSLLTSTQEFKIIGSFVAGMFVASMFTALPATIILAEIAKSSSIYSVAFFGAMGALVGDVLIFLFVRNKLSSDLMYVLTTIKSAPTLNIFRVRYLRQCVAVLGAFVVASPLPDELGLIMMGLSDIKVRYFFPLAFFLHSSGILAIGLLAKVS